MHHILRCMLASTCTHYICDGNIFRQWNAMHVRKAQCAKWKVAVVLFKLEISLKWWTARERMRCAAVKSERFRWHRHANYFDRLLHIRIFLALLPRKYKMPTKTKNELPYAKWNGKRFGLNFNGQILCKHIFQWQEINCAIRTWCHSAHRILIKMSFEWWIKWNAFDASNIIVRALQKP